MIEFEYMLVEQTTESVFRRAFSNIIWNLICWLDKKYQQQQQHQQQHCNSLTSPH